MRKKASRPRHARMLGAATRGTKQQPTGALVAVLRTAALFDSRTGQIKTPLRNAQRRFYDPYGNRTHVTAVKGPCLNRLTNGP